MSTFNDVSYNDMSQKCTGILWLDGIIKTKQDMP